ncbi:MAG: cell division protein FtsQ/DivIB [Melioribacteraceae bacterium]|nr:cell division protein FtsQ/DivIB [Melioribacteraceae bacterium]
MIKKVKIGSVIFFSALLLLVFSLSLIINNNKNGEIKFIELKGDYHLSQNDYLIFAKIENQDNYNLLTPRIVKDRLEKHPYISKVDVLLIENKLSVEIVEKKFESLLMFGRKEFLISAESIIIPKLPNSEKIDYPIISNPFDGNKIKEFKKATENEDVKIGLKILSALKIINPNLYDNLSEINLRNGKDILLQFSKFNAPVVLGRDNEIEKIMYLEKLIQKYDQVYINNDLSYIDLRYSNYIYIGKSKKSDIMQESNT